MKRSIAFLLLAFAAATAQAGSFGGPPPFTNGSPLTTGMNGNYQASARGSNLSGVITFVYANGVQSTIPPASATATRPVKSNSWVIFYQGEVFTGNADVAINDGSIAGVLEAATAGPVARATSSTDITRTAVLALPDITNTSTQTQTSSNTLTSAVTPSGYFSAKMSKNSPTGSFKGSGVLSCLFTDTIVENDVTDTTLTEGADTVTGTNGTESTTSSPVTINAPFKLKGVRVSTSGT